MSENRTQETDRREVRSVAATLGSDRALLIVTFIGALVLGGIIALVTGQYWAIILAAALHAIGSLVIATGAIQLTTE
ncbi:MAG TPA: hypothetical protein VMY78_12165 [Solirubrobacteraceae bacterium]|nr:hypothetical protein [Solirubrobacteraceae bacterium]